MVCKDCLHFNACVHNAVIDDDYSVACGAFKDKSSCIELPCKVGDTVYQTDGVRIYSLDIAGIIGVIYDTESIAFDSSVIGKSIYLTREEAEKALEGMK